MRAESPFFLFLYHYTPYKMIQELLDLFFPKVCAGCDNLLLAGENVICTTCRHEIPQTNHHLIPENEAFQKFYGKVSVEFVVSFLYFHKRGIVQHLIHNLKYKGCESIGIVIGDWFSGHIAPLVALHQVDEIVPVPLHPKRLRKRGYNQVTKFGKSLSENLGIPYNDQLLIRKIHSKTQTRKNLLKRTEVNQVTIFDAVASVKDHQKHFLLIDDVITTGSTLEACARALLKIPGAKISIVTIAFSH